LKQGLILNSGFRGLRIVLATFFLLLSCGVHAQLTFSKLPRDFALIPRSLKNNRGDAHFTGEVSAAYSKINYTVLQNGKAFLNLSKSLISSGNMAPFDFGVLLPAGKYNYQIHLHFIGKDTLKFSVSNLIVGDVYIIQGQSNAVANSYSGLANTQYKDSFIRSFGNSTYDATTSVSDSNWYIANGDGYYNKGCIGQWGLVMAKHLLDSFKIPIAIINGAVGGTPVSSHLRYNPIPENPYTIYGRLLYRMRKAGLDKNVRGLFWFQGESDGPKPYLHDSLFRILYADWTRDYKGMELNYLVQVRGYGCGNPGPEMMEVQRRFEFTLTKLKVISSNGLNGHDGCHYYFQNGYGLLGKQLAALVSRDLYHSGRKTNIDPPGIDAIYWNHADRNQIVLQMRQPNDSIFADAGFEKLFYVTGDPNVFILSGNITKNKVILNLNQGTCLPLYLTYMGQPLSQPWVKNKIGAGLVSFNKIRVLNQPQQNSYYGCAGENLQLGSDSIAGCLYKWRRKSDNKIFTSAKINHIINGNGYYELIIQYKTNGCNSDTTQIGVYQDNTPRPYLGKDTVLCNSDSLHLELNYPYASLKWVQNNQIVLGNSFFTIQSGNIIVAATSSLGCKYMDSLLVKTSLPEIKMQSQFLVCPNKDTLIYGPKGFVKYDWNPGQFKGDSIRLKTGVYTVVAEDSLGCTDNHLFEIKDLVVNEISPLSKAICTNDSILIQRPEGFISWNYFSNSWPNSIWQKPGIFEVLCRDSNGCVSNFNIRITEIKLPEFQLGNDTGICEKQFVELECKRPAQIYRWNGVSTSSATFKASDPGIYVCELTENGCTFSDSLKIFRLDNPVFFLQTDTVICSNTFWEPALPENYKYWLNGEPVSAIRMTLPGQYFIRAQNPDGCSITKTTILNVKNCVNGIETKSKELRLPFPNPAGDFIVIPYPENTIYIYDMFGKFLFRTQSENGKYDLSLLKSGCYIILCGDQKFRMVKE